LTRCCFVAFDGIKSTMPRVCEMCLTGASTTMLGSSDDRIREKRAQDVLYIYDAMYIFNATIEDDLIPIWKSLDGTLTDAQRKSVRAGVKALFTDVNDIIREAIRIPTDRRIEPDDVLKLCQSGFEELLGAAD
jgi:hypothetical protein